MHLENSSTNNEFQYPINIKLAEDNSILTNQLNGMIGYQHLQA